MPICFAKCSPLCSSLNETPQSHAWGCRGQYLQAIKSIFSVVSWGCKESPCMPSFQRPNFAQIRASNLQKAAPRALRLRGLGKQPSSLPRPRSHLSTPKSTFASGYVGASWTPRSANPLDKSQNVQTIIYSGPSKQRGRTTKLCTYDVQCEPKLVKPESCKQLLGQSCNCQPRAKVYIEFSLANQ